MVTTIDAGGETPRPDMAEYRSENGFVVLDAAIMLLSADLTARIGATFCRAKRSSSAGAVAVGGEEGAAPLLLVPCDVRLCLFDLVVWGAPAVPAACGCSDVREWSTVIMSNPGSLGLVSGYDEADDVPPVILSSVTVLRRARLRLCKGGGEGMLKELEVDRLALTPDRPSETLSDIIDASLVVANSLMTMTHNKHCMSRPTHGQRG
jgi:hypothetical protein